MPAPGGLHSWSANAERPALAGRSQLQAVMTKAGKQQKTVTSRSARPLSPAKQLAQRLFGLHKQRRTDTQKLGVRWLPLGRTQSQPKQVMPGA